MNNVEIIYKKQKDKKVENEIWAFIRKAGIWALFGKKDKGYECLQVGKCKDVGYEILYDISCMNNLSYKLTAKKYVNEFGLDTGLRYEDGIVQEYLYPYLKVQRYKELLFVYVCDENDEEKERLLAWLTHAKYWRDFHRPLEREMPNRYEEDKISKIGSRKDCAYWETEKDIMAFLENIVWS